jgi:hypothetical protein
LYTATDSTRFALSWPITYWSRISLIRRGLGTFDPVARALGVSMNSSSTISRQSVMHSSQM